MKNAFAILALIGMAIGAASAPARATEPVTIKFAFPGPVTAYLNTKAMTPWIEAVERSSGGALNIKLFAGPTLGTFRNMYERILSGVAQIGFGIFGPFAGQFPRTQVANLPFLSSNTEQSSVALWRVYAKGLFGPEYRNVKVLALFNFPNSALHADKPVKTLADLKGLKLAVPSRTLGEVVAALGASPVTLTPTEVYQGLSRGVADGAAIAWTAVRTWKLDEVTKDHLEAPLGEAPAFVFMNRAVYAALPDKLKRAINENSGESFSEKIGAANQNADDVEARKVAAEPGQSVTRLSAAQYPLWQARIQSVIAGWVKHTPDGAKVLAAYREEIEKLSQ